MTEQVRWTRVVKPILDDMTKSESLLLQLEEALKDWPLAYEKTAKLRELVVESRGMAEELKVALLTAPVGEDSSDVEKASQADCREIALRIRGRVETLVRLVQMVRKGCKKSG